MIDRMWKLLVLFAAMWVYSPANAADDRPNILLIYTDDHSHRSVSCHPEAWDWVHTPHIEPQTAQVQRRLARPILRQPTIQLISKSLLVLR